MARITEQDLVLPSLYLMSLASDNFITTSDLKQKLVHILRPTGEDAEISPTRKNEIKFMQIVGNLKSHDTFERNGFAAYKKTGKQGGFEITNQGRVFLNKHRETIKYLLVNDFDWENLQNGLITLKDSNTKNRKIKIFDENIIIQEGFRILKETPKYQRSKELRNFAIDYYSVEDKISCECCPFDFANFYGEEMGKGFIEIHHRKPIFKFEDIDMKQTLENAVKNLIPVCSNCHRMIHRNWNKAIEIEVLINSIQQNGFINGHKVI